MATSDAISLPVRLKLDADRRDGLGLVLSGALPLSVFVIVHGMAGLAGVSPLFFAPFGLPGQIAAVVHVSGLLLFGLARWMVASRGVEGRRAGWWLVGLMGASIAFPFVVIGLDPLLLSAATFALFLLGLAAGLRVGRVSPSAALLMVPALSWMGLSAFVGISLVASWAPPFGLTNGQGQAAS